MKKAIEIFTDGSSLGNPGPGGWGIVAVSGNHTLHEAGGSEAVTTNNRMELRAVIEALTYISHHHVDDETIIHTDSAYVLGGITTWVANWEKNGWRTSTKKEVLNQDLWKELMAHIRGFQGALSWKKVKGHSGHIHNERADEIATHCSSLQTKHIL